MIPFHLTAFIAAGLDWLDQHRIVFLLLVMAAGIVVGRLIGLMQLRLLIWREGQKAESEWRDRHRADLARFDRLTQDIESARIHRLVKGDRSAS